ncbi:type II toxin-antitoxin system HipA family toxin YjjJ [Myxococcus xanthus]|uniref:Type II toxin-antitoxin system HipA family toxin YjjJ n=1 Tax=Myxococcus xanthus TaxID=34 RepID=A0A7Y4IJP5_MYXXA|nr:type II toxin-antitoxin system HipA family toxin YjjJ [Myxococcus xanthus]NOJ80482.1 type II toxin-antitoxin system HipA family toxin YjjJ [Myxococcus xanthus]NOJ87498.1 type II toxin-antitoxin system HipA family toxin YjjJ [Myxococcus xanthus]
MATLEQLLAALGRQVEVKGSELAAQLRVSRPTVSRLLASAGPSVCRMGQGPATRYARTRSIVPLGEQVRMYRVDETGRPHEAGVLHPLWNGGCWIAREDGVGERFAGLPPFAADMSPQGYLGRGFTSRHPELGLPPRITDWTEDHQLIALALRGDDCVGNHIIGAASLDRFLASPLRPVTEAQYPELARSSMSSEAGSSAGGEQPKFTAYTEGRHVLVKFAANDDGAAAQRWRELLVCEGLALEAVHAAGIPAAATRSIRVEGYQFLEVERFDRVGERGRKALLSLKAIDNEYLGHEGKGSTWTSAARYLLQSQYISDEDARRIRWLDTFGQLTGNTDRHFGNLSFFEDGPRRFRLAPAYDMLPMMFAPVGTSIVERSFEPRPPTAETLDVWADAAQHALAYWNRLEQTSELSDTFRGHCARCRDSLAALMQRTPV